MQSLPCFFINIIKETSLYSLGNPLILYENAPSLYPSPSMGEGYREGVIFILRCARTGHGGYSAIYSAILGHQGFIKVNNRFKTRAFDKLRFLLRGVVSEVFVDIQEAGA